MSSPYVAPDRHRNSIIVKLFRRLPKIFVPSQKLTLRLSGLRPSVAVQFWTLVQHRH